MIDYLCALYPWLAMHTSQTEESEIGKSVNLSSASDCNLLATTSRSDCQKRKQSSWVWNNFEHRDGRIVCLECLSEKSSNLTSLAISSTTSNLSFHSNSSYGINEDSPTADLKQMTLSSQEGLQRHEIMSEEKRQKIQSSLAKFIVGSKFSFNFVENPALVTYP